MSKKTPIHEITYLQIHPTPDESSLYTLSTTKNETNDTRFQLNAHARDYRWTEKVRGKPMVKVKDNGNGMTVKFVDGPTIKLDYCQFNELAILADYNREFVSDKRNQFDLLKFVELP